MIKIDSDNAAIEKNIRLMEKRIEEYDGYLDPDLYIKCENGELSVEKEGFISNSKPLIALPGELLFPTQGVNITVKNDQFSMDPEKGALTDIQTEMAETVLDLYNLTDKIKVHKESCCWITYGDTPEAMDELLKARTLTDENNAFVKYLHDPNSMDEEEFLCDSYIKTRTIGHNEKKTNNSSETEETVTKIMPIVDFINHNLGGAPFNFNKTYDPTKQKRDFLCVGDSRPLPDSNECFAFYNQMDCLDALISYGFPDTTTNFIRSVPVEFDLPDGTIIKARGDMGIRRIKVSKKLMGLRPYIPGTTLSETDRLEVTHFIIPCTDQNPHALRRVLRLFISNRMARKLNAHEIWAEVLKAEEKILTANEKFYADIVTKCDAKLKEEPNSSWEMTRYVAKTQLTKLYKYRFDDAPITQQHIEEDLKKEAVNA